MKVCRGSLILHRDGTPVCCSEEVAGGFCGELSYERHRIFRSCGLTFRDGCPECLRWERNRPVWSDGLAPGAPRVGGYSLAGIGHRGQGRG